MDALLQRTDPPSIRPSTWDATGWSWRDDAGNAAASGQQVHPAFILSDLFPNVRLHAFEPLSFAMRGRSLQEAFGRSLSSLFDAHWRWLSLLHPCPCCRVVPASPPAPTSTATPAGRPRLRRYSRKTGRHEEPIVRFLPRNVVDKPGWSQ